jgi:hypothetical protein
VAAGGNVELFLFGFCKIGKPGVQLAGLSCILQRLRLANRLSAAAANSTAVGVCDGWNDKSVEEQDCCCENQKGTFHGRFLLVTSSRKVMFSWPRRPEQRIERSLTVRNS